MEKLENKSKEHEVVLDAMGEAREKQRVEVEFGTFHEFTAVNKTKGYDCLLQKKVLRMCCTVHGLAMHVGTLCFPVRRHIRGPPPSSPVWVCATL